MKAVPYHNYIKIKDIDLIFLTDIFTELFIYQNYSVLTGKQARGENNLLLSHRQTEKVDLKKGEPGNRCP